MSVLRLHLTSPSRGLGGFLALVVGWALLLLLAAAVSLGAPTIDRTKLPPPALRPVDFEVDVRPLLAESCYSCHGPAKQKGGLRLDLKSATLRGGDDGPVLLPGHSADSPLIHYVSGLDPKARMPKKGDPLSAEQVGVLRAWIDQGAKWPDPPAAAAGGAPRDGDNADKADHWAYKPLTKPDVPDVRASRFASWPCNAIDAFVLAKLEEKHLAPSPPADKRTLIRRVTYDLTGLPPTPEEVRAFEANESADAYEKVVDRLLASAAYGERWARHWLDVVHYGESHGYGMDRPRPNAWPYRDYVIRSFDEDKPYVRFVREQLAGDVLFPDDPQGVVALGFIASGPWNQSPQAEQMDDIACKKIAQNLDRDDMVMTAMSTFVSTTVHCARCHDHKFDPVSQAEYYGLQAVFAGVDRVDRPYDPDPKVYARRLALMREKARLSEPLKASQTIPRGSMGAHTNTGDLASVVCEAASGKTGTESPTSFESQDESDLAALQKSFDARYAEWTTLEPVSLASEKGSVLTKQPDGSVLASGPLPETDAYTVVVRTDRRPITAVRLEVLTDDSLPHHGPGRQPENGNITLSEFRLSAAPAGGAATTQPAARSVPLGTPSADFNQKDWGIEKALDGKSETGWAVDPQEGAPHVAVFPLKEPVGFEGGTVLTSTLEQKYGRKHLIGKFRLSATTTTPPSRADATAGDLARLLSIPASQRTAAQKAELLRRVRLDRIEKQLAALGPPAKVYAVASDFEPYRKFHPAKTPRPVFVLRRGDIAHPAEPAVPGALSCVPGLKWQFADLDPKDESARRAALANWVADPANALTWRSIVNRVWQYHFGRGIVETANDFGHMGARPTHPELLDWLAVTFRDGGNAGNSSSAGGLLKQLHRLLVTSATYRQSSGPTENSRAFAAIDAGNQYLWRMNRTRLDAECVRDAILQITGKLDPKMGGPSVKQFKFEDPNVEVTPTADYAGFDVDSPESRRRSVYRYLFRTLPDPFMDSLDCADASQLTAKRNTSVTALQALSMWNDRFVVRYSEHFAERVAGAGDLAAQVDLAYRLALARSATGAEKQALANYARKSGMANACRVILNSNEFLFVD